MTTAPKQARENGWTLEAVLPWLLVIGGLIALVASVMLSIEVFDRLKNPSYVPVCNLNPVLSCTNVADSNQAHAFGFPNYFIGIAGYAAVTAIGVAMLAGAKFKQWFWRLVEAGLLFAFLFITWLQFQTLYRIGALCLFCMIVWACTGPMFWYATLYNLSAGHAPKKLTNKFPRAIALARRHHGDILLLWFLIIIALILKRFWYYWSTLA
ncbi:MAG TPA: vitamin K epoxide reductase family protein [Candidatus Saccharimonadales bacterium]|nr:vitamin K epoxide reductase family protein [Candidatus Saccharimonadales bacterium]